jgi:serine/threonine protein kinase/lipoprotein NlpI
MTPNHALRPELDDYVAAYEEARAAGGGPRLDDFLPPEGHKLRRPALRELVRVSMELDRREGCPRPLEDYLRSYPALVDDPAGLGEVAYEEYRLRLLAGERPTPEEYAARFGISTASWFVPALSSRPEAPLKTEIVGPGAGPAASAELAFSVGPLPGGQGFPEAGERLAGFRLVRELGRGSFGRVYLAEQEELSARPVALKLSPPAFVGEAHTLARLQHTHIVPIYSLHGAGRHVVICMPYLGGLTLLGLLGQLRREPALPRSGRWIADRLGPAGAAPSPARQRLERSSYVEAALWLTARLAEGLAHAHERGVLHRDLKPANVLLADDGTPMLLDFNLAQEYGAEAALTGGTLPYMAPEYLAGVRQQTARSEPSHDVYALGLILWELLSGRRPYPRHEGGLDEVLPAMVADRRRLPAGLRRANPAVTPAVEAIVLRCLDPRPERRYKSAAELRDDIERHLASRPLAHTREPSLRERFGKWRRRHPRLASSGTAAALAFVVLALLFAGHLGRERSRQRLLARTAFQDFKQDAAQIPALLAAPDADPALVAEGLERCRDLGERYQLSQDDWQSRPIVQALPPDERGQLLETMGEVLWLWGRAVAWKARTAEERGEALRLLGRARDCYPPGEAPAVIARQEARLLALEGRPEEARRAAQEGERPPGSAREHYLALLDQLGRGRYREALPLLQQAARREAGSAVGWLLLARAYVELGQPEQARYCGEVATSLAPDWPWSWYHQGLMFLAAEQHAQARLAFDRVLKLRPGLVEARLNRAIALLRLGLPREALPDLDAAIEMGSPFTRVYFIRAEARARCGDKKGADADRQEGLKREPADELSWVVRALAWLPAEPARALADLDRALACNPASPDTLQNRAHVLSEHLGRVPEAIACLDRLLDLQPDKPLARAGRAVLLARRGRREAAHRDAALVVRDARAAGLIYQAACAYALTAAKHPEDAAEAVRLLQQAFQLEGRWVDVAARDPDLDPLRGEQTFVDLLRRAKEWYRAG